MYRSSVQLRTCLACRVSCVRGVRRLARGSVAGSSEIIALEDQRQLSPTGEGGGKAVADVQLGPMALTLAEAPVDLQGAARQQRINGTTSGSSTSSSVSTAASTFLQWATTSSSCSVPAEISRSSAAWMVRL